MAFIFDGIRSLPCICRHNKQQQISKGDSEISINVDIPIHDTAILERVDRLKNVAIRKARILARLNFLAMFLCVGITLYSGIYNVSVLSVISGISIVLVATLQWGPLSESYGKIAVRLTTIYTRMKLDPSLSGRYAQDLDDIEVDIESIRIVSYLWS
jgi:hypothetical protein